MKNLHKFMSLLVCGMSTITLFPHTDYCENTAKKPQAITAEAWQMTGNAMRKALDGAKYYGQNETH